MKTGTMTTIDQVLSSASNALLMFAVAQVSSAADFGVIAMLIVLSTTWLGFNRGALGTPILLASNLNRRSIAAETGYATTWSLGTGLFASGVLLIAGLWVGDPWIGLALAISLPPVLAQDVLRFCAVAQGRPQVAVYCDGAWVVGMLVLYLVNLAGAGISAEWTVYLWGAGGLLSALVLGVAVGAAPRLTRIGSWWKQYGAARFRFGFVNALNQAGATTVTIAATVLVGSVAAGGLRGAAAAFGPMAMLISALPMVFLPHARNSTAPIGEQWRLLVKTSALTSTLTITAALCLYVLPVQLGAAVLGDTWSYARPLILYIALEYMAMCWIVSMYALFQALGMSRAVFGLKVFQIGTQLILSVGAGLVFGTASAIAMALAVCGFLTAAVGSVMVVLVLRRHLDVAEHEVVSPESALALAEEHREDHKVEPEGVVVPRAPWPVIDVLEEEEDRSRKAGDGRS